MLEGEVVSNGHLQEEELNCDEALPEGNQECLGEKGFVIYEVVQERFKEVLLDSYDEYQNC